MRHARRHVVGVYRIAFPLFFGRIVYRVIDVFEFDHYVLVGVDRFQNQVVFRLRHRHLGSGIDRHRTYPLLDIGGTDGYRNGASVGHFEVDGISRRHIESFSARGSRQIVSKCSAAARRFYGDTIVLGNENYRQSCFGIDLLQIACRYGAVKVTVLSDDGSFDVRFAVPQDVAKRIADIRLCAEGEVFRHRHHYRTEDGNVVRAFDDSAVRNDFNIHRARQKFRP